MLKKIRIIIALFFFTAITLLFLDFTGTVHTYLGWCAKIQFIPALLAAHFAVFFSIIVLTLLVGRIYCSTICPLGVLQDIVLKLVSLKKKMRWSYKKPRIALRYSLLAVFVLFISISYITTLNPYSVLGRIVTLTNIAAVMLEPYSAFGRIASQLLSPVYELGNNLLAYFAERIGSYTFYSVDIWLKSTGALIAAILTFTIIVVFVYRSGRGYCNNICPIGTVLGLLAKFSLFKPRIDLSKCEHCGVCAKNCKASCIEPSAGKIDYTRCVTCFNCTTVCPQKGIVYAMPSKTKSKQAKQDGGK
jgi:polyferredoxin